MTSASRFEARKIEFQTYQKLLHQEPRKCPLWMRYLYSSHRGRIIDESTYELLCDFGIRVFQEYPFITAFNHTGDVEQSRVSIMKSTTSLIFKSSVKDMPYTNRSISRFFLLSIFEEFLVFGTNESLTKLRQIARDCGFDCIWPSVGLHAKQRKSAMITQEAVLKAFRSYEIKILECPKKVEMVWKKPRLVQFTADNSKNENTNMENKN